VSGTTAGSGSSGTTGLFTTSGAAGAGAGVATATCVSGAG
jgi:hypothetical protein